VQGGAVTVFDLLVDGSALLAPCGGPPEPEEGVQGGTMSVWVFLFAGSTSRFC